jgi:hypothetical protein
MDEEHRVVKTVFETKLWVDGEMLPLNHMMQETLANVILGFAKTLKGISVPSEMIEVKIKVLPQPKEVDAHTYP